MANIDLEQQWQTGRFREEVKKRSDYLMNYFLAGFFLVGLSLAYFHDTWRIAIVAGGSSVVAYYIAKIALPKTNLYQYVLSIAFAIFTAQFIFQTHGLLEMHFTALIGSAILITYQNWKLQIPLMIAMIAHHLALAYMQNLGIHGVYFAQLGKLELPTLIVHFIVASVMFFTSGLWAYQLKKYNELQILQSLEMGRMEKEDQLNKVKTTNEEGLKVAYLLAERARMAADAANRAKSIFLATMSHEIRTPLNGVIGMASLLSETRLNEEQTEYAKTISTCSETLLTVINDILDFSKIESGNMELESRDFDLRTCIEEVLDMFSGKAGQHGLDLVYEIGHEVPAQLIGDNLRLRQVLMNLVSNAIKFTRRGEIFIGVHLASKTEDEELELEFTVRDSGIGIPADKMERLFKPFSQVDSSTTRRYGGTGLGLVICEKIIGLMGGSIEVESVEGEGTTFSFTIRSVASSQKLRTYLTHHMAGIEGKKILIVDDNFTNSRILKNQLELWKLAPTLAESGSEALAILSGEQNFDLLLTDMQMPEMDGCELARKISELYPALPIILLSSVGDELDQKHSGLFSSVLTKPIKQEMLSRLIINELRGKAYRIMKEEISKQKLSADFANEHPMRILVAEDNAVNQKLALRILAKLGYEAHLAENGKEVIEMTTLQQYDVILMDVQMPEMDGLEATRIIRTDMRAQTVIIAMTANAMNEDKDECLKSGMNDFLSKPVKLEDLVNMLEKWYTTIKQKDFVLAK